MTREEAIKLLEYPMYKWSMDWSERDDGLSYTAAIEMAIAALREPKRERGEWVFVYRDQATKLEWHECSICKRVMHYYPWSERDNFCPCCGADMRPEGGADDE